MLKNSKFEQLFCEMIIIYSVKHINVIRTGVGKSHYREKSYFSVSKKEIKSSIS